MNEHLNTAGEILLNDLINTYKDRHNIYKSQSKNFWMLFMLWLLSVILTPVLALVYWLLGNSNFQDHLYEIVGLLIGYGLINVGFWLSMKKSQKRLNVLKIDLEGVGLRICCRSSNNPDANVSVIHEKDLTDDYAIISPLKRIEFKEYNQIFNI